MGDGWLFLGFLIAISDHPKISASAIGRAMLLIVF